MRKVATLSLTIILGAAFMLMPSVATSCGGGGKIGFKANSCGAKAETVTAEKTSASTKDAGLALATFSVKGMTCGGCEAQVSKTLKGCEGVSEVVEVSHKDNTAVVKYDPSKVNADNLAATITKLGYKAEVLPAVAKTTKEAAETESIKTTKDM